MGKFHKIYLHLEKQGLIRDRQHGFMQDRSCLSYLIECFEVVSNNRTVDGSTWISRFLLIVWLGRLCPQPLMLLASPLHSCRPKPSLSPQLRPPLLLYPISSIPPYPCPPLPPPYTITPLVSFSFSYFFRISRSPLFLSLPAAGIPNSLIPSLLCLTSPSGPLTVPPP